MILRACSFEQMNKEILDSSRQIIVFGAGMLGTVTVPALLDGRTFERISYFVDNDEKKWDTCINVNGRDFKIHPPHIFKELENNKYVILIAISRFSDILRQMEMIDNLSDVMCYLIPVMCVVNFEPSARNIIRKDSDKPLIPQIIHYMWLGKQKIPKSLQYCIDSWKKYCPDYEIKCWNEDNYDIGKNLYMKQAYDKGAYGFVPDYARLDILYNYGGIYLDTDVELVKSLDDMLYQEAFCCVERWQTINFGGGSGAIPGHKAILELLNARENLLFVDSSGNQNRNTCGYYDTQVMQEHGYELNGKVQNILGMNIYPSEVFHPYDYASGRTTTSVNTHGIHHFNGGWLDDTMQEANKKTSEEFDEVFRSVQKN